MLPPQVLDIQLFPQFFKPPDFPLSYLFTEVIQSSFLLFKTEPKEL